MKKFNGASKVLFYQTCRILLAISVGTGVMISPSFHIFGLAGGPSVGGTPSITADMSPNVSQQGCANGKPTAILHPIFSGSDSGSTRPALKEIALTFDDGPFGANTTEILTILEARHIPATFFAEGQFIQTFPDLIRREWRDGDAIGLHTWNHPHMTQLSDAQLKFQFQSTIDVFHRILGQNACMWFWRPPYGAMNAHVLDMARSYGLSTILWNDFGEDSRSTSDIQHIISLVMLEATPAGIVLLHDGPRNFREKTGIALPKIIDGLQARGYSFVTVPQLLADEGFAGVSTGIGAPPIPIKTPTPVPTFTPIPTVLPPTPVRRRPISTPIPTVSAQP